MAWQKSTDNTVNAMENGRGDHYRYDEEGQLASAWYETIDPANTYGNCQRQDHFGYDELGNRRDWNHVATRSWQYFPRKDNGLNQYRAWSPYSVINYDDDIGGTWGAPKAANGVLMQDGNITAGFNALNQPMYIWSGTSGWIHFGYDPLGRCVKRWNDSGAATYLYYDGWNLIQEGPQASNPSRLYIHGARVDELVAQITPANKALRYFHYDANGNCILQTDASGALLEQYSYDAFGYPYFHDRWGTNLGSSPSGNRFLFTGREWLTDLKLYDYRHRLYQPELGRFLQPDPKHFAAGDYNLYRYCHNDPINKTDPMGLDTAVAIGGARWDSWGDSPNPLGHASLALTGQGTFSFGTLTPQGTNFTSFLGDQSAHRWTAVYIIKTTPAQDAAIKRNLEGSREKGKLPDIFKDSAGAYKDNCATRTADALREGGQNVGHPKTPGALQHKLEQKVLNGTATRVFVPQQQAPAAIPPVLKGFDKK